MSKGKPNKEAAFLRSVIVSMGIAFSETNIVLPKKLRKDFVKAVTLLS